MFGKSAQQRLLESKLEQFAESGALHITPLIPIGMKPKFDNSEPITVLRIDDNNAALLLGLINETEALYKHFDSDAHRLITVLIAITPIISNAPFFLGIDQIGKGLLITLASLGTAALSIAVLYSLRYIRHRKREMFERSIWLQSQLDQRCPELGIKDQFEKIREKNKVKADSDAPKGLLQFFNSRSKTWDFIAVTMLAFSCVYICVGLALAFPRLIGLLSQAAP